MSTVITRRFSWDSAHKVLGHEGRCKYLHGHRYEAEVVVYALRLDDLGRVIDFSILKDEVGKWIDTNWDHNVLLNYDDPLASIYRAGQIGNLEAKAVFSDRRPYFMPSDYNHLGDFIYMNPTVENIAKVLYQESVKLMRPYIKVARVRVYETANCWADYEE